MRLNGTHFLVLALALCPLAGCSLVFRAPVPMRAVDFPAKQGSAKCLVVFLPGYGDGAQEFETQGFVEEFRRRGLAVDMVAAEATVGYYTRGSFAERLSSDVIAPRRARGYAETWLIGPSMGGFGTLFYARQHLADVTGVLALAPYLGDKDLIEEVYRGGGLHKWAAPPPVEKLTDKNYQPELLRWLQAVTRGQEQGPLLNLGFGHNDKLAHADELLAAVLPPEHVYRNEGNHKWGPWRDLLSQFLDRGELAKHCR
jgi:pimeloyl-ACP methyl ester carboxylesterase